MVPKRKDLLCVVPRLQHVIDSIITAISVLVVHKGLDFTYL